MSVCAQVEKGYGIASDSTESNYKNYDRLGGVKTVGAQLKSDNQKKESFFRIPIKVMKPWYDWKKDIVENTGIEFGMDYIFLLMKSSDVIDEEVNDKKARSGIFNFNFIWNLINRKSNKNKGTFTFKISSRHSYKDRVPPMFHGVNESGYFGLPAAGYNDYAIRMLEFHYSQLFFNGRAGFVIGKIDASNYFNFHGLAIPSKSFMGYGALLSGTINIPDVGFGLGVGVELTDCFYLKASVMDVRGDIFADDKFLFFGNQFFDGNMMTMAEIGWAPTIDERYFKNFSFTYWHSADYINNNGKSINEGSGVAFSSHWFFNNKYMPFLRLGFSDGNGENAFYKRDVQLGCGFYFKSHDLVGIGFSTAEPNIPGTKDQLTGELFYRAQITQHFAITPDLQWIHNPTLNQDVSNLWYFGIRGRITM